MTEKRKIDRQKAHSFIKLFVDNNVNWIGLPANASNEDLDKLFDVRIGTFALLRRGEIDPPKKLISGFKDLAGECLPQNTDSVLIRPFLFNSKN